MSQKITFSGSVEMYDKGMQRHVVYIPVDALNQLGITKVTRLIGTINGVPFNLAALSNGEGRYYLTLGKPMRQDAKVMLGQLVNVVAEKDPKPREVDLPEELEVALDTDPDAQEVFNTFTPGYKRSLTHYVNSAKRIDTRIKRALELCEKMKAGTLHGMQKDK